MAVAFGRFLRSQWPLPADPNVSFSGKDIILTDFNTELGFEAASQFVALGASCVILVKISANALSMIKAEEGLRTLASETTLGDEAHERFW